MSSENPYQAPGAKLADAGQTYGEVRLFGFEGRMGRLRFLSYSLVSSAIFYVIMSMVLGILAALLIPALNRSGDDAMAQLVFGGLSLVVALGVLLLQAQYGVRRLHDLGYSGWLWLVMLLPVVNLLMGLYLLFAPGATESNRFGAPPPPNSAGVWIGAVAVPVLGFMLLGILAAIAFPAYHDYTQRAQAAATSAEVRELLSSAEHSSGSAETVGQWLLRMEQRETRVAPNVLVERGEQEVTLKVAKPDNWKQLRFILSLDTGSGAPTWVCRMEGEETGRRATTGRLLQPVKDSCTHLGRNDAAAPAPADPGASLGAESPQKSESTDAK